MSYDSVVLAESALVNYWKLGESSGSSTAADSKGSATLTNSSTTFGGTGLLPSDAQTSAAFNGSSDPGTASTLYGASSVASFDYTQPFSLEFTVRPNFTRSSGTFEGRMIAGKAASDALPGWYVGLMYESFIPGSAAHVTVPYAVILGSDGTGAVAQGDSADLANAANCLVLATYDGSGNSSGWKFYVNGAAAANRVSPYTTTPCAASSLNSAPFAIGGIGPAPGFFARMFDGSLERVSLYGAELSSAAAAAHYSAWSGAGSPLIAGTLAVSESGVDGILFSAPAAGGGTGTITQNLQRATVFPATDYADLPGLTTTTPRDVTAEVGTLYHYRTRYADSNGSVYSNTIPAEVYLGGPLFLRPAGYP